VSEQRRHPPHGRQPLGPQEAFLVAAQRLVRLFVQRHLLRSSWYRSVFSIAALASCAKICSSLRLVIAIGRLVMALSAIRSPRSLSPRKSGATACSVEPSNSQVWLSTGKPCGRNTPARLGDLVRAHDSDQRMILIGQADVEIRDDLIHSGVESYFALVQGTEEVPRL